MTQNPFEITQQMRDLAEKNVEQARATYGQFLDAMTLHRISRRSFLAAATLFAMGGTRASGGRATGPTFLVVGDWGTGSNDQRKVAIQMAKSAEAIGAQFVISTGDNFYPHGVTSVDDPQWKTHFEDVYNAPALQLPWYIALGNHDHEGNVNAQVRYTDLSPRWRLPATYYKFTEPLVDGSHADFFVLDSESIISHYRGPMLGTFEDVQMVWLEHELAASTAAWKIVVGHHPVFSGGWHKNTEALVALLQPLLERYGVPVYLSGHNHNLEHVAVGKTHYLTSGAGAKPRPATAIEGARFVMGDRLGFMTARLTPAAMDIEFLDGEGVSLYRARIPVEARSGARDAGQLPQDERRGLKKEEDLIP